MSFLLPSPLAGEGLGVRGMTERLIVNLAAGAAAIRQARYGVIDCQAGRLRHVQLRLWPKWIAVDELLWGRLAHRWSRGDRCRIYYNQPLRAGNYLAIKYALSTGDCSLRTMHCCLAVLDQVAWLKRSDALLCDVWNLRISDRFLARYGWQRHLPASWHRHFIKRFYGVYPQHARVAGVPGVTSEESVSLHDSAPCFAASE